MFRSAACCDEGAIKQKHEYFAAVNKSADKGLTASKTSRLGEESTMVDFPRSYLMEISPPCSGLEEGRATMSSKLEI